VERLGSGIGRGVARVAIGAGLVASCVAGCSGGVLAIGSDDAGEPPDAAPAPEVFTAGAVAAARSMCALLPADTRWTSYTQDALRSDIAGGWLLCYWRSPADARSFEFTADGRWYTLVDDGSGGLRRESSGDAGGLIGYQGTYSFADVKGEPSGTDGLAVYLATNGVNWFHPEFTGRLMTMNWATDGSQDTCVRIGP
jgi:hypothetical protein